MDYVLDPPIVDALADDVWTTTINPADYLTTVAIGLGARAAQLARRVEA